MKNTITYLLALVLLITTQAYSATETAHKGRIALLFLTMGDLNHSNLWKEQLALNKGKYKVYVHSKTPLKDPFFRDRCIKHTVPTTWLNHVQAWKQLIKAALKDRKNTRFVYLSESCVPLHPLSTIYDILTSHDKTYMNYWKSWWTPESSRAVLQLPEEHRWINSEWCILNRRHAQMIADDIDVIRVCDNYPHSQESHPSSLFSYYNALNDGSVINYISTYVNFELGKDSHPYTFAEASEFNLKMLRDAKEGKIFFARKIATEFPEQALKQLIQQQ